ncbi:MAG: DUF6384 family protein [Stappiaceae bacterium]
MAEAADKSKLPLDEIMMAMDVVDTLRHKEKIAERELADGARESNLIERLQEIYKNQGIDVPDHILAQGVAALKEERFVYKPPESGFNVLLARLYVSRTRWGTYALAALAALLVVFAIWFFLIERPRQQAIADTQMELTQTLPTRIGELVETITGESQVPSAIEQAQRIATTGRTAASEGMLDASRDAARQLERLLSQLRVAYDVRVVSRPGTPSGLTRIPDVNTRTENFYLVVEAVGADEKPIALNIKSEEDGKTDRVSIWAQRVPERTFEAVRKDKADDGIVQKNLLGTKKRGFLQPNWQMRVEPGAITKW